MIHPGRIRLLMTISLVLIAVIGIAILTADRSEAQPQFRNFNPPRNPVADSVSHSFEFPNEVRTEALRNKKNSMKAYSGFVRAYDEHETVSLVIPINWNDIELDHAIAGDHHSGVKITASTDLFAYENNQAPGITVLATGGDSGDDAGVAALDTKAGKASRTCGKGRFKRYEYTDPFYSGHYDIYSACSNGPSHMILAASPEAGDVNILIEATIFSEADFDALMKVIDSFQVTGEPGHDEHHDHEH